ncbi:MAG: hypothetical protein LBP26_04400 [Clostridiales bacterium]|jgi:hypothetical protein|nr:hypothetical protein [Clostridiales bacterium]
MKKFFAVAAAAVCAVLALGGCGDKPRLARTPPEEYARIANLEGDNRVFNTEITRKLQIYEELTLDSEQIKAANGGQPIKETLLFQFDRTQKDEYGREYVQTYHKYTDLRDLNLLKNGDVFNADHPISIESDKESGFKKTYSNIGGYYETYADFLRQGEPDGGKRPSVDYAFNNYLSIFPPESVTDLAGSKTARTFSVWGSVKSDSYAAVFEWLARIFPATGIVDSAGVTVYANVAETKSVKFQTKSTAAQLTEISVTITTKSRQYTDSPETLTVAARIEFAKSGFSVSEPRNVPDNWPA